MDSAAQIAMELIAGLEGRHWAFFAAFMFAFVVIKRMRRVMQRLSNPVLQDVSTAPEPTAPEAEGPSSDQVRPPRQSSRAPAGHRSEVARKAGSGDDSTTFRDAVRGPASVKPHSEDRGVGRGEGRDTSRAPSPDQTASRAPRASDFAPRRPAPPADPNAVSQALRNVKFKGKPLMAWDSYCLMRDLEAYLAARTTGHRLLTRVRLDDAFAADPNQYSTELTDAVCRALSPFEVDFIFLDRTGVPVLGICWNRTNAVIEAVFDQAGLPLFLVEEDYAWPDLEAELDDAMTPMSVSKLKKSA